MRKTVSLGNGLTIGGDGFVVMAGPCAVESREQLLTVAEAVAAAGAAVLRGGAFKPRTSPKSFQGLGEAGLRLLSDASNLTGLPVVTEVMDPRDVELVAAHAAMLQVGSRNMQNFPLLREVGRQRKPVLLKRGAAATLDELLLAADYIRNEGNGDVLLCERGVRGFDPSTRYLLDLAAVPVLRSRCDLPIIVDPSHGTGAAHLVAPMAKAAMLAGADGLLIEVHANPEQALCDGKQALRPEEFAALAAELRHLAPHSGRRWIGPVPVGGTLNEVRAAGRGVLVSPQQSSEEPS
ncbi:MAG: 3-deoxy-7-phosphoheptulonate synthase [Planctomycetes bacterium]|nr:3-deoxy-7-phosphoheptulonate synthase [Planctomycetota bacterium]MCB9886198.1 3-deoxy-7-phosphoheptulonate synthase [Planctomycetota bacterium]